MKLTMINTETNEICLEVEDSLFSWLCCKAIKLHTSQFGEDYLFELLEGLSYLASNEAIEYTRKDFSTPESNFTLTISN